jgi:serine protein kinase
MRSLKGLKVKYNVEKPPIIGIEEYIKLLNTDPAVRRTPFERMLSAIGEPEVIDTSKNVRLSRIFGNRLIKKYKPFSEFYGMEEVVERIVSYFKFAAQGLEESRQILYLLGPVGGGKSSIAEKLKELIAKEPVYVLTDENGQISPVFETPLSLLSPEDFPEIPKRYFKYQLSPWGIKRLEEYNGDISRFKVAKLFPNESKQYCISKTEPGDDNNQDISALVGKTNIRKLEYFDQNDPDSYSYSGGLNKSNQGLLEFVEMFKSPIKILHPLLTATQEGDYNSTEGMASLPFEGIILAHSNESEWNSFKNDNKNEAFIDRVYVVKVPYCLRVDDEVKIYEKLIKNSDLCDKPIAPNTLDLLAKLFILTRLEEPKTSNIFTKLKVYNGESVKEKDPSAKSLYDYKMLSSKLEGFRGLSTRLAHKVISQTYNYDTMEIAANPVHLFIVIEQMIYNEHLNENDELRFMGYLNEYLILPYIDLIGDEIQKCYLDSYSEYGQNLFDRYITYADYWLQDQDYRDPDTGQLFDRGILSSELEKLEIPAEITNKKDFRNEVVNFCLHYKADHGVYPDWTSYSKLKLVIEKSIFDKTENLLPIISFHSHKNKDDSKKHVDFINRMKKKGYTEKQIKLLCEWFIRYKQSA